MIKLEWVPDPTSGPRSLVARVPGLTWDGKTIGHYLIQVEPRPHYCDRGNWKVLIDHTGALDFDDQDGFPRYFFSLDSLKSEMEAWVNKRGSCLRAVELMVGAEHG